MRRSPPGGPRSTGNRWDENKHGQQILQLPSLHILGGRRDGPRLVTVLLLKGLLTPEMTPSLIVSDKET